MAQLLGHHSEQFDAADVDRAKQFYHEQVGFVVDRGTRMGRLRD